MGEINYNVLSHERTGLLQEQFQIRLTNRGTGGARPDGLRYNVLNAVTRKAYDQAIEDMKAFLTGSEDFPIAKKRCERYVEHCVDLIKAIKKKRDFPGLSSLPIPKQHEVLEAVLEHFDELTHFLKRIEAVNAEARLNDLRSTVYVLRTICYSIAVIFVVGLGLETVHSIYGSYDLILSDVAKDFTNWLFNLGF